MLETVKCSGEEFKSIDDQSFCLEHFPKRTIGFFSDTDFLMHSSLVKNNCTVYKFESIIYP